MDLIAPVSYVFGLKPDEICKEYSVHEVSIMANSAIKLISYLSTGVFPKPKPESDIDG